MLVLCVLRRTSLKLNLTILLIFLINYNLQNILKRRITITVTKNKQKISLAASIISQLRSAAPAISLSLYVASDEPAGHSKIRRRLLLEQRKNISANDDKAVANIWCDWGNACQNFS